jgi:hypothetical protein
MTGGSLGAPASLDFQGTYLFVGSNGNDGQFYRVIARHPGLRRGFFRDAPRVRYRFRGRMSSIAVDDTLQG